MPRSRKSQMDAHIEERDEADGDTTVIDIEETPLFLELDDSNPKHKELLLAAKKFAKLKAEHDSMKGIVAEQMKSTAQKVISLMHECEIAKFRHKGVEVTAVTPEEKIRVKVEDQSPDDE